MSEEKELTLLRAFWNQFWNGPGSGECACGMSAYEPAEMVALDDLAAAVEDHYAEHGFPLLPKPEHPCALNR